MATTFKLKLTLLFNQRIDDLGGNWQYAGANAVDVATNKPVAQLIATKRENANCCTSFPASILTATVMFPPAVAGGVSPNMTLQGVHDLTTNNETGSVSAASPEYADQIGETFSFDATSGVLRISPPA